MKAGQTVYGTFSRTKYILIALWCFIFAIGHAYLAADTSASSSTTSSTWTLAAEEFTFPQLQDRTESETEAASVIPQLVLEQIVSGETRTLPAREVLNRKLDTLLTARLALFLQLSKEMQTRDALVLSDTTPRELEKEIIEENKKIEDIQKQIADNLAQTDKETDSSRDAIEMEEGRAPAQSESPGTRRKFSFPSFPFFHRSGTDASQMETVSLYKSDSSALFAASAAAAEEGYASRTFDREIVAAKINGLLTGTIVSYGEYAAVTATLYVYPGGVPSGTITEVGLLDDPLSLARRIARYMIPKVVNSTPVSLRFEIMPPEAVQDAVLSIDGLVYRTVPETAVVDAGIHTVTIESKKYETATVTYSFTNDDRFTIRASLVPRVSGTLKLRLAKYRDGLFYADGVESGPVTEESNTATIAVNGKAVLGRFMTGTGDDAVSAFYYIPVQLAAADKNLIIDAVPFDRAANIDKRRRRMYTAYSALICSLPLTFYFAGNFTSASNGYALDRVSYNDAISWQNRLYGAAGISIGCGIWFAIELARYLHAANAVLPATAKTDTE